MLSLPARTQIHYTLLGRVCYGTSCISVLRVGAVLTGEAKFGRRNMSGDSVRWERFFSFFFLWGVFLLFARCGGWTLAAGLVVVVERGFGCCCGGG